MNAGKSLESMFFGIDLSPEFQRRRNLPGTTVRYLNKARTFITILSNNGKDIGERFEVMGPEGKVIQRSYHLP